MKAPSPEFVKVTMGLDYSPGEFQQRWGKNQLSDPYSTLSEKGDQECLGHNFLMSRSAVRYVSSKSEA